MNKSIVAIVAIVAVAPTALTTPKNDIRELSSAEILIIGAAGGLEEFPVIPR